MRALADHQVQAEFWLQEESRREEVQKVQEKLRADCERRILEKVSMADEERLVSQMNVDRARHHGQCQL